MFNPQIDQRQQFQQQMEQPQDMQEETKRQLGIQMGTILLEQKTIMERINAIRIEREKKRRTCDMYLFFKYNNDITPISINASQFLFELLNEYKNQTGNQNVRFFFKGEELVFNTNSPKVLYEINGLRSGEEIIVRAA